MRKQLQIDLEDKQKGHEVDLQVLEVDADMLTPPLFSAPKTQRRTGKALGFGQQSSVPAKPKAAPNASQLVAAIAAPSSPAASSPQKPRPPGTLPPPKVAP